MAGLGSHTGAYRLGIIELDEYRLSGSASICNTLGGCPGRKQLLILAILHHQRQRQVFTGRCDPQKIHSRRAAFHGNRQIT